MNTLNVNYLLSKTLKKVGSFLGFLEAKKVVEQFPQGNIGEGFSNEKKVIKSGGVSFISLKITKKQDFSRSEVIHVK